MTILAILLLGSLALNILLHRKVERFKSESSVYRRRWRTLVIRQARQFVRAHQPKVGKVVVDGRLIHAES